MAWNKLGKVFDPKDGLSTVSGWAAYPTPIDLGDRIRVFYAPRSAKNQACITFVDLDRNDPTVTIRHAPGPVLESGKIGTFDDCGVQPMQAIWVENDIWLYYLGWNPAINGLSRNSTGLAISKDRGVTFQRCFEGPILDRSREEPYFSYTPWVLRDCDRWKMWYATGTAWVPVDGKPEGAFELRDATSDDGISWTRPNRRILPPNRDDEVMCKPNVTIRDGMHHMWFSYRSYRDFRGGSGSYKIGYATSQDGHTWERDDQLGGLSPGESGAWDSDMVCFSSIATLDEKLYIFFTGNGFGATGFGVAEWTK